MIRLRVILLTVGITMLAAHTAPKVQAATLGVNLYTHHVAGELNNTNPGMYVVLDSGWGAGVYRNSIRQTSVHVDYTSCSGSASDLVQPCITIGAVNGYKSDLYPAYLRPLVLPSVRVNYLRITALPAPRGAGVHFSIERPL